MGGRFQLQGEGIARFFAHSLDAIGLREHRVYNCLFHDLRFNYEHHRDLRAAFG